MSPGDPLKSPVSQKDSLSQGVCPACKKAIRRVRKGSFTSWVFSSAMCSCDSNATSLLGRTVERESDKQTDAAILRSTLELADDQVPEMVKYEVIEFIGRGGMGSVYRAKAKENGEQFAIKVLRQEFVRDPIAVKRFEQEATAASKLSHPNLAAVFGHDRTVAGAPYIIMEYLNGRSLAAVLREEGKLSFHRSLNMFIQVCDALSYAHQQGVIHRDVTPGNIILTATEDGEEIARVVDFGIAKVHNDLRATQEMTETGSVLGSPSYMSPEQCLALNLDARSDIYSLGCVIYETVTGHVLFDGENPVQIIARHLNDDPSSVRKSTEVPGPLLAVIATCLQRDASKRYDTINELRVDLQRLKEGKEPEFCQLSDTQIEEWSKKKPVAFTIVGLIAFIGVSVVFAVFPQADLFKLLAICATVVSIGAMGYAGSRLSKTVLGCSLRMLRLIDIVAVCMFVGLLCGFLIVIAYCLTVLFGLPISILDSAKTYAPNAILGIVYLILYLAMRNVRFAQHSLLSEKWNTKLSRILVLLVCSCLSFFAMQRAVGAVVDRVNPTAIEKNMYNDYEIATLTKLIDKRKAMSFNLQSNLVDELRFVRAKLLLEKGEDRACLDDLNQIVGGQSAFKQMALADRSMMFFCVGDFDAAQTDALSILKTVPEDRQAILMLGLVSLANRDAQKASEYFDAAQKQKITPNILILRSFAARIQGKNDEASALVADAITRTPQDFAAQYLAGKVTAEQLLASDKNLEVRHTVFLGWDLVLKGKSQGAEYLKSIVTRRTTPGASAWEDVFWCGLARAGLNQVPASHK